MRVCKQAVVSPEVSYTLADRLSWIGEFSFDSTASCCSLVLEQPDEAGDLSPLCHQATVDVAGDKECVWNNCRVGRLGWEGRRGRKETTFATGLAN